MQNPIDFQAPRSASRNRSFAKDLAEIVLYLELTGREPPPGYIEDATAQLASARRIPANTLKRCTSEARAVIEFAHESGALRRIGARAKGSKAGLREDLGAWLDQTSLSAILKDRARRLNGRYGGRPSTKTRTLRAVEELVEIARDGRKEALDELRAIRELVAGAPFDASGGLPAEARSCLEERLLYAG